MMFIVLDMARKPERVVVVVVCNMAVDFWVITNQNYIL
jgi:hypothetical protein